METSTSNNKLLCYVEQDPEGIKEDRKDELNRIHYDLKNFKDPWANTRTSMIVSGKPKHSEYFLGLSAKELNVLYFFILLVPIIVTLYRINKKYNKEVRTDIYQKLLAPIVLSFYLFVAAVSGFDEEYLYLLLNFLVASYSILCMIVIQKKYFILRVCYFILLLIINPFSYYSEATWIILDVIASLFILLSSIFYIHKTTR